MHLHLTRLLAVSILLSACGSERGQASLPGDPAGVPATSTATSTATDSDIDSAQLEIIAGGVRLIATLRDTAAARDLRAQLPITISMRDHGGVEKTGRLPEPLSLDGEPDGADPDVADLGYYAPGNDLVLYYGDQSYFPGILVLGRLSGDVGALAELDGDVEVQVSEVS